MNHNGVLTTGEELYEHNYEAYETFREEGTKVDFKTKDHDKIFRVVNI